MAFMSGMTEEELKQQGQGSTPAAAAGGSVMSGSGGTGAAPAASSGSGYTNLDKYLTANKDQGGGLADTVTNNAQGQIDSAKNGAVTWGDALKSKADAASGTEQANQFASQIKQDPTKVDQGAFKQYLGSSFGVPTSAMADTGYAGVADSFAKAAGTVNTLDDRGTQKSVLQSAFKGAVQPGQQYTNGMSNLDSFILNGDKEAQGRVQGFKAQNAGLQDSLNTQVSGLDQYLGGAKARLAENQAKARQSVTEARGALQSDVNNRVSARQADIDQKYNTLMQQYGNVNPYNTAATKASSYVVSPLGKVSAGYVMNANDQARMAALSDLAGDANPWAGVQLGTMNDPRFDQNAYNAALASAKQFNDAKAKATELTPFEKSKLEEEKKRQVAEAARSYSPLGFTSISRAGR